jgi:hypothetical protein
MIALDTESASTSSASAILDTEVMIAAPLNVRMIALLTDHATMALASVRAIIEELIVRCWFASLTARMLVIATKGAVIAFPGMKATTAKFVHARMVARVMVSVKRISLASVNQAGQALTARSMHAPEIALIMDIVSTVPAIARRGGTARLA